MDLSNAKSVVIIGAGQAAAQACQLCTVDHRKRLIADTFADFEQVQLAIAHDVDTQRKSLQTRMAAEPESVAYLSC